MIKLLTARETEIINKKKKGISLTQNESNILSKYIRPKLREMAKINPSEILNKIEYNQEARAIESKIKKLILEKVSRVDSIIICGSFVQTNYKKYKDIDIIVATKKVLTKSKRKKEELIEKIEEAGEKQGLNLDIQIYAKSSILSQYAHSPSLIYQLKDSKTIYGKLKIPNKIILSSLDLRMKLDWSDIVDPYSSGKEIYQAIKNAVLVLLLMNKKVNNAQLIDTITGSLGEDLVDKLKDNNATKAEKKTGLQYLKLILKYMESELKNPKWEKIEISSH